MSEKSEESLSVRDFVYVDEYRLYSLYSQVFEGVADSIVDSFLSGLTSVDEQKSGFLGPSLETKVAEVSLRSEYKSLYDHMYNRLELKLGDAILAVSDQFPGDSPQRLRDAFLVKVTGGAEIEDYDRLNVFMKKFNELADAIGYSNLMPTMKRVEAELKKKQEEIDSISSKKTRENALRGLKKERDNLGNEIKQALDRNELRQDEVMLKNLSLWIEMFNPGGFDITITPQIGGDGMFFRGILKKDLLRMKPSDLRSLYGCTTQSSWTMVGQVTYVPDQEDPAIEDESTESLVDETSSGEDLEDQTDKSPSMRDPFRNMFSATQAFERMFLESAERTEVIIAPLAIYREVQL